MATQDDGGGGKATDLDVETRTRVSPSSGPSGVRRGPEGLPGEPSPRHETSGKVAAMTSSTRAGSRAPVLVAVGERMSQGATSSRTGPRLDQHRRSRHPDAEEHPVGTGSRSTDGAFARRRAPLRPPAARRQSRPSTSATGRRPLPRPGSTPPRRGRGPPLESGAGNRARNASSTATTEDTLRAARKTRRAHALGPTRP